MNTNIRYEERRETEKEMEQAEFEIERIVWTMNDDVQGSTHGNKS